MSGLGKRGKDKVATTDALFQKTEKPEPHKSETMESHKPVKKSFEFSFELAEKLRERAFRERRKEVDIVREALALYLKNPPV
ncbi:MAG: hypothetical protein K2O70_02890 [Desulfovibrionaceae bacterium]|nr:hypothetical protein [Desulfovibrionaceae bacterium]